MTLKSWVYFVSLLTSMGFYYSSILQREFWSELLDGEPLPYITELSLRYGFILPFICVCILYFRKKMEVPVLMLEMACIPIILICYYSPYLSITWNL